MFGAVLQIPNITSRLTHGTFYLNFEVLIHHLLCYDLQSSVVWEFVFGQQNILTVEGTSLLRGCFTVFRTSAQLHKQLVTSSRLTYSKILTNVNLRSMTWQHECITATANELNWEQLNRRQLDCRKLHNMVQKKKGQGWPEATISYKNCIDDVKRLENC